VSSLPSPATDTQDTPPCEGLARILEVAERLFAARGYDAVSIQDIADAAEVSKANVFHHFGSKEKLYFEVLNTACGNAARRLDNLERHDQPIGARLKRFAAEHLDDLHEHQAVTRLILRELLNDGSRQGPAMASQVFGDKFARFVAILSDAQKRGELRRDLDPALVATLLIGANVFFFQARDVLRHFPDFHYADDPDRYAQGLADLLLRGISRSEQKTD
jgi:TetR/AcrR family transcriptional regulator